jgi:hypothetical protein
MSAFVALADIKPLPIWHGILARVAEGRELTFAVVELEPGAAAARHQHPNEQLGLVLTGTMRFVIGDDTRELVAGDVYLIPGNTPHEATAGAGGLAQGHARAGTRSALALTPGWNAVRRGVSVLRPNAPATEGLGSFVVDRRIRPLPH